MTGTRVDVALEFCTAGCSVVPARTDGDKSPALEWAPYMKTAPSAAQVSAWLADGRYDGFGLVCGKVSGNLEMLEFEGRAVIAGVLGTYAQALTDHGLAGLWKRITDGYCEATPSGGVHVLYRVDGGPARGNTKLARRPATADELANKPEDKLKVLIETRGESGYVIVAPSGGRTHPTGRPWAIVNGGPATIATVTAAERDALYAVATLFDRSPPRIQQPHTATGNSLRQGERPGDGFAARTSWEEILAPHGWRLVRSFGNGAHGWCRPGKDRGISATTRDNGGLYVFSTSTPFDTEEHYTKFGAYAVLEHGGDYRAAARALAGQGYGRSGPDGGTAEANKDERTKEGGEFFRSFVFFRAYPRPRDVLRAGR
jgi:putative DNA primase/helicase